MKVWSKEKAKQWYGSHKWICGANYINSNAINQLEMWQASTFDTTTIDRELGFAQDLGYNTMRVFLHSQVWKEDPDGFKNRINKYLEISNRHRIQTVFVFFDDCWNPVPIIGLQPAPKPGIHNSGWFQDPGFPMSTNPALFPELEKYMKDIMNSFATDTRILMWDIYNEPGNSKKGDLSISILKKAFQWARETKATQPITSGVWNAALFNLNKIQIENSDVITYHDYCDVKLHKKTIDSLSVYNRPMICTEYMARTRNSTFQSIMPLLKENNIGAINWGLVSGKTNTIYSWEDVSHSDGSDPKLWFHDILTKNGKPYRLDEVTLIKRLASN